LSTQDSPPQKAFQALIGQDMLAVDGLITGRLSSGVPLVGEVAQHIILAGGKRLRPVLLLLMAGALGYKGTDHHKLAAVIEFIHTATLLHDDVVDDSNLRRGRPTANAMFGNPASVLVGDFLYSRAFQMMVEHARRVPGHRSIFAGDSLQNSQIVRGQHPFARYFDEERLVN
jgi:octaprenyl-diphosphate synthase